MATRRIGSLTLGGSLVVFVILFLVHTFWDGMSYGMILRFWQLMLISLGTETLLSLRQSETKWVYDKGAIVMMILLGLFAMMMAAAQFTLEWWVSLGYLIWYKYN